LALAYALLIFTVSLILFYGIASLAVLLHPVNCVAVLLSLTPSLEYLSGQGDRVDRVWPPGLESQMSELMGSPAGTADLAGPLEVSAPIRIAARPKNPVP
jgi:hypothetical protein